MTEVTITASTWVVYDQPTIDWREFRPDGVIRVRWKLRAEASVTDPHGAPVEGLKKSVWGIHVTDAAGATYEPGFTVANAKVGSRVLPGFYVLTIVDLTTNGFVAPTAFGIVVSKGQMHGQVVVPIRYTGLTVHTGLVTTLP